MADNNGALALAILGLGKGGGGTSDYEELTNKPSINDVTLSGDLALEDLGIETLEAGDGMSLDDNELSVAVDDETIVINVEGKLQATGASQDYVDGQIDLVNDRIDALPHGMQYKGVVLYYDLLPQSNVEIGDMYTVKYLGTSEEAGTVAWGAEVVCAKIEEGTVFYEEVGTATNINIVDNNLVLGQSVGTVVDTTLVL